MIKNKSDMAVEELIKLEAAEYVHAEGGKISEEACKLNEEDSEPIPEENLKIIYGLCDTYFDKQPKIHPMDIRAFFYKISVAVAILLIALNISIVSVPAMRNAALNFLMQVTEKSTQIQSFNGSNEDAEIEDNKFDILWKTKYEVTYLPEGFRAVSVSQDVCERCIQYEDGNDNYIHFMQASGSTGISLDTEGATVKQFYMQEEQVLYIEEEKYGQTCITMLWKSGTYFIMLESKGVGQEDMMKVAESIRLEK